MLIKVVLGWVDSNCSGQPHIIVIFVVKLSLTFFRLGSLLREFRGFDNLFKKITGSDKKVRKINF